MAINKEKNTRIVITLPKDIKEKVQIEADKDNRTMTNYIVNLIIKDLEDKSKNAQKVVKKKQINEDDVTEKMIHQIENDNGRQTKKKRTKK